MCVVGQKGKTQFEDDTVENIFKNNSLYFLWFREVRNDLNICFAIGLIKFTMYLKRTLLKTTLFCLLQYIFNECNNGL